MKSHVPMALLLSVLAAPVLADSALDSMFLGATFQVAQVSPAERRMMRERWEQASPEERMMMRRQFQERMQQPVPEQRLRLRERGEHWINKLPTPGDAADMAGNLGGNFVGGFGTGFEHRHSSPPSPPGPEDNAPGLDPRNSFVPPAGWFRR